MTSIDEKETRNKVSRRDFLKYSAGAAAVAAGASAILAKIPQTSNSEETPTSPALVPSNSSDPIVVMVQGDELTVMRGLNEAKIKDSVLAALIARKAQ